MSSAAAGEAASRPMHPWPDRLLPDALREDAEVLRRARLTVLFGLVLVGTAFGYALFYGLVVGYPSGARILAAGGACGALVVAALWLGLGVRASGLALTATLHLVVVGLMICEGGVRALATPLLSTPPIIAILLLGRRSAVAWIALSVLTLIAFGVAEAHGVRFPIRYPAAWAARMSVGSPIGQVLLVTLPLFVFEQLRASAQARADAARADAASAALTRMAYEDALTGLANRARFLERLGAALTRARGGGDASRIAVLLLDLDGFKAVNDTLGHAAGDELLAAVSARLLDATRGSDLVARLGGDEFAVLLDRVRADADAITVAERVLGAVSAPFPLATGRARVGVSVGIARGTADGTGAALLRDADAALYRAKARGKGCWALHAEPAGTCALAAGA